MGPKSQEPIFRHTPQVAAQECEGPSTLRTSLVRPAACPSARLPEGALALVSGESLVPFSFPRPAHMSPGPSAVPGTPVDPCLGGLPPWLQSPLQRPLQRGESRFSSCSARLLLVGIRLRLAPNSRGQRGTARFSKSADRPGTDCWAATPSHLEICCLQQRSRPKVRRTPGQPGSLPRKPVTCCSPELNARVF